MSAILCATYPNGWIETWTILKKLDSMQISQQNKTLVKDSQEAHTTKAFYTKSSQSRQFFWLLGKEERNWFISSRCDLGETSERKEQQIKMVDN